MKPSNVIGTSSAVSADQLTLTEMCDDGIYTTPPAFPPSDSPDDVALTTDSDTDRARYRNRTNHRVKLDQHHQQISDQRETLVEQFSTLSQAELVQRLVDAQLSLHEWRHACSDIMSILTLCPELTELVYARSIRVVLRNALMSLESVDGVGHIECSMPCVNTERPLIDLNRWDGLHFSEWAIQWFPKSWWLSVSVDGSRWGIAFNILTTITNIRISGVVQLTLPSDLTAVRVRFAQKPKMSVAIDTSVGWGIVPVPVHESIQQIIRDKIEEVVHGRLCNDNGMVVVLRRKLANAAVSDSDLYEATMQAKRANNVKLRSSTFF